MKKVKKLNLDLGLRAEYLTSNGKGKGYFSLDLQPVGTPRFYRLELSSQPYGVRHDTTTITTITYPDGHTEVVRAGPGRVQGLRSRSRPRSATGSGTGSGGPG